MNPDIAERLRQPEGNDERNGGRRANAATNRAKYRMIQCIIMAEVEVEVRRWGNSLGVILPAETVRKEALHPRDRVRIQIVKVTYPEPGSFGSLADAKIDAAAFKKELRRDHAR